MSTYIRRFTRQGIMTYVCHFTREGIMTYVCRYARSRAKWHTYVIIPSVLLSHFARPMGGLKRWMIPTWGSPLCITFSGDTARHEIWHTNNAQITAWYNSHMQNMPMITNTHIRSTDTEILTQYFQKTPALPQLRIKPKQLYVTSCTTINK